MRILCGSGALQCVVGSMGLVNVEQYVSPMFHLYYLPHRCRYRNAWRLWSQRPDNGLPLFKRKPLVR